MDIPGRGTHRNCESAIGQLLRPPNPPLSLATMIPQFGMMVDMCVWSPLWEVRSRVQRRCPRSPRLTLGLLAI